MAARLPWLYAPFFSRSSSRISILRFFYQIALWLMAQCRWPHYRHAMFDWFADGVPLRVRGYLVLRELGFSSVP